MSTRTLCKSHGGRVKALALTICHPFRQARWGNNKQEGKNRRSCEGRELLTILGKGPFDYSHSAKFLPFAASSEVARCPSTVGWASGPVLAAVLTLNLLNLSLYSTFRLGQNRANKCSNIASMLSVGGALCWETFIRDQGLESDLMDYK